MATKTNEKAQELREKIEVGEINTDFKFTLGDAIRLGSMITTKAEGWGDGENACAMHSAVISAKAWGAM